ncbi:transcriptional regulator [Nitrosopumilus sp. b1]|uniref:winged helix-turn-helix domain-containing protein n=1 Tax=Nitrosopumilus sp. b1 TaxID=2109907 RepID=UPI0015F3E0C6|nr:winged helix-turn-helix domain-containing protein [Nitrosopumilus sp. b1]KAF6242196.1 transcriptional regulator [Nitrosopumilus sp. b1]
MALEIEPHNIQDMKQKQGLLEIVSDKYCRDIIQYIQDKPKSAIEISFECNIPISTAYRRIQFLVDNRIITTTGYISEDGKKFFLYKSKIKGVKCHFQDGSIEVQVTLNK